MWVYAVALIGVAPATVSNYTAPAFTVLLSWLVWREPITWRKLGAVALAFVGCVLAVRAYHLSQFRLNWVGLLVGLGTGVTWATFPIFSKMLLTRYSSLTVLTYAFGLSALTLWLPQPGPTWAFPWAQPVQVWVWLGLLALVPTVGGFCLYSWALNYLTASAAILTAALEIVLAACLAFAVFGDTLEWGQILGGGLILAAIVILARQRSGP
jgi:drug/metabolite transporter (DMT)-like permease